MGQTSEVVPCMILEKLMQAHSSLARGSSSRQMHMSAHCNTSASTCDAVDAVTGWTLHQEQTLNPPPCAPTQWHTQARGRAVMVCSIQEDQNQVCTCCMLLVVGHGKEMCMPAIKSKTAHHAPRNTSLTCSCCATHVATYTV